MPGPLDNEKLWDKLCYYQSEPVCMELSEQLKSAYGVSTYVEWHSLESTFLRGTLPHGCVLCVHRCCFCVHAPHTLDENIKPWFIQ